MSNNKRLCINCVWLTCISASGHGGTYYLCTNDKSDQTEPSNDHALLCNEFLPVEKDSNEN